MLNLPENVTLSGITLNQAPDSCDHEQRDQVIKINIDDAGGGKFIILETTRWAIDADEIYEFAQLLKDLVK